MKGLFAIRGILRNIYDSPQRFCKLGQLYFATPELRNRQAISDYLRALSRWGFVEKTRVEVVPKKYKPGRWSEENVFSLSERGKAFLELFPPSEREEDGSIILREGPLPRPTIETVRKILETLKDNADLIPASFSYLIDISHSNRKDLLEYLKLLKGLGWIKQAPYDPILGRTNSVAYTLTEKGDLFLELVPEDSRTNS